MEPQDLDANTKLDILKFIHQDQRGEMEYRRQREYRIFTSASTVLLALIGTLLITKQTEALVWKPYGSLGNGVASVTVVLIIAYSTVWQLRNSRIAGENAQVIRRISVLLHCFEKGYFDPEGATLFPDRWTGSGQQRVSFLRRLFTANYVSATALLGILALIMIWVP